MLIFSGTILQNKPRLVSYLLGCSVIISFLIIIIRKTLLKPYAMGRRPIRWK